MTQYADRVQETTSTTGTGTINLNGAITGYQAFSSAFASGTMVDYCITDGSNWEVGNGMFNIGTPSTIARTTVYSSSQGNSKVNFTSANMSVFNINSASKINAINTDIIAATNSAVASSTAIALSAKTSAEAARDAALIQAGVYATEALGRAAVADGVCFKVQGVGDVAAYEYRRVNAGTVSTLVVTYPSKSAYDTLLASLLLKADLAIGKNLFNPSASDYASGYFVLNTTGALQANVLYNCSGYIPVVAGTVYTVSEKFYIAWYNAAKVFISGTPNTDTNRALTAPTGAAFIRVSFLATNTTFQIEIGSSTTSYETYGVYLLPSEIKARSLTNAMHAIGSISADLTNFITPGKNLFNKATILANSFMGADGSIAGSQPTFFVTDYIKVQSGSVYTANKTMRFTTFFDSGKGFVAGGGKCKLHADYCSIWCFLCQTDFQYDRSFCCTV